MIPSIPINKTKVPSLNNIPIKSDRDSHSPFTNANNNSRKISLNSAQNQISHRSNLASYRSDISLDVNQPNMVANFIKKIRSTLDLQKNNAKNMNLETLKGLEYLLSQ